MPPSRKNLFYWEATGLRAKKRLARTQRKFRGGESVIRNRFNGRSDGGSLFFVSGHYRQEANLVEEDNSSSYLNN